MSEIQKIGENDSSVHPGQLCMSDISIFVLEYPGLETDCLGQRCLLELATPTEKFSVLNVRDGISKCVKNEHFEMPLYLRH